MVEQKIKDIRSLYPSTDKIIVNFIINSRNQTQINGISGVNIFYYIAMTNALTVCQEIRSYWKLLTLESVKVKMSFADPGFSEV